MVLGKLFIVIVACLWSEVLLNFMFFKVRNLCECRNHACELDPQGQPRGIEYLGWT